ncbi:LysM peptidoglycan-binding domain-containing protein [Brevibacterium sediminis]
MYLLIACASSWLVLLGSFAAAWERLPQPWTTSDVVVIVIIGTGSLLFARIGLISLLALLLQVLPTGRFRSALAGLVVKAMPRILASSVLAIVSAGLVVHSAQAAPLAGPGPDPASSAQAPSVAAPSAHAPSAPADPGWPTIDDDQSSADPTNDAGRSQDEQPTDGSKPRKESEPPDRVRPPDPGWPTDPPADRAPSAPPTDRPSEGPTEGPGESDRGSEPNDPGDSADAAEPADPGTATHVVAQGESLWSIAADLAETPEEIPQLVAHVYAANEDTIGPDPSLIIAGQRLEIQK